MFLAKLSPNPMLTCYQLDPWEQTSVKFQSQWLGREWASSKLPILFPKCPLKLTKLNMIMKEVPTNFSIYNIEIENKVPIKLSTLPNTWNPNTNFLDSVNCFWKFDTQCPIGILCAVISTWWCHQMETFSALLAICAGNSPVSGEFPTQRPVMRSFDVFFDLHLIKRLSKHSRGWWFETLSCLLWRHCNHVMRHIPVFPIHWLFHPLDMHPLL